MLYASGLLPICVQAAAAVFPELIPAPSVPRPVHKPAAKKTTPSMLSKDARGTTKSNIIEIIKQKIMGVSIRASLIKVNERSLSYALVFLPKQLTAA